MRTNGNALQVYKEALGEVRSNIAHASTLQLQMLLSRILSDMGKVHISQYDSPIANGPKGDKGKCTNAKALCEEALSILYSLSQYGMTVDTLTILASVHGYLEMFDEARSTLKEALDLTCNCHGEESTEGASCHQEMAFI